MVKSFNLVLPFFFYEQIFIYKNKLINKIFKNYDTESLFIRAFT